MNCQEIWTDELGYALQELDLVEKGMVRVKGILEV